jgi:integrase
MATTYDVRVWKIRSYKGKRGTTYTVRWIVAGEEQTATFATFPLADAERSKLIMAQRVGEAFDTETGRPMSWVKQKATATRWYSFAVEYADAKWAASKGNGRKNTANALVVITTAMLSAAPKRFTMFEVRQALRGWAFVKPLRDDAPPHVATVLTWLSDNTLPMSVWEQPDTVHRVMAALSLKLDGKPAGSESVKRYRGVLHSALEQARIRGLVSTNPLDGYTTLATRTSSVVDKRCLINPEQAAALLGWIQRRPRGGKRLYAFFATLYYAGLRPEEAISVRVRDLTLPETGWGEVLVHSPEPEVGKQWTDTGEAHDVTHLKGRTDRDVRPVPLHPSLVAVLRAHVRTQSLKPDDRVFQGERGGILASSVYRDAWQSARKAMLPELADTPLGARVYDLRHTCLTTWLNSGVPPAQVAAWAGNSVKILLSTYALCISGQERDHMKRIEDALKVQNEEEEHQDAGDKDEGEEP